MNSNHTLTIQARVKLDEKKVIDNYAKMNNISISDLIRNTLLEKIEDEIDLDIYKKEMARYKKKSFYWYKDVIMNNGKDI